MLITLSIKDTLSRIWYSLCEGIASLIQYIYSFLPDNPFDSISIPAEVSNILGYLNYFLPIKQFIVIIAAWLVALIGIVVYKLIFSFFKLIGG